MIEFDQNIRAFLKACSKYGVKMIMVGGGAVNFYGYQRHSADLDFWISTEYQNLENLKLALVDLGFEEVIFPQAVLNAEQNISIKISPLTDLELITRFNPGKTFHEAYERSISNQNPEIPYKVIHLEELLESKKRAARPKDLLDIQELKRIHGKR